MDGEDLLDGFQFHDQLVVDHQVHAISAIQLHRFVDDGQGYLAPERDSIGLQFIAKTLLIREFQEPWTQGAVYFDGETDD
jgi:hypothetical protein